MPQPKQSTGTSRPRAGSSSAGAAKKPAASRKPAAAKSKPAARKPPATAKKAAAPVPAPSRAAVKQPVPKDSSRRPVAQAAPGDDAAAVLRDEALRSNIAALRDVLASGVVITTQRVQEAMDDAVMRGRITREDAEQIVQGLLSSGRRQAFDVLAEIDTLLGRGRDKAIREADKVRRAAKIGSFPILRYDDLTAAQIIDRLADLGAADLRKIRDYEARNANRKVVLGALDKALG